MPKATKAPADYILPLYINGLSGRMLRMSQPKDTKREILFVYGYHASLERYFGVADLLNKYAGVTMPDLPGFGGMDSFYKIGEKPNIDTYADYLAAFIKLRFRNKKFVIAGYSLGVPIITRMLQKYPELSKKIQMLVSIAGFTHKDDFNFSKKRYWIYRLGAAFFSARPTAALYKLLVLRPIYIRYVYRHLFNAKQKFKDKQAQVLARAIEMEVNLWRSNDPRTYMATGNMMFKLELPNKGHVGLPIYHAGVDNDHYFNSVKVEQHMRMIYSDFVHGKVKSASHAPSIIATAKDAAYFVPKEFIRVMNKIS
ncbi:alpha/beta hydrolase [Candidatus Saccharibacteria bacterium]|nr:alpha/beta hydrolase [Candidatus Saccharibacteria bacterium]